MSDGILLWLCRAVVATSAASACLLRFRKESAAAEGEREQWPQTRVQTKNRRQEREGEGQTPQQTGDSGDEQQAKEKPRDDRTDCSGMVKGGLGVIATSLKGLGIDALATAVGWSQVMHMMSHSLSVSSGREAALALQRLYLCAYHTCTRCWYGKKRHSSWCTCS